jgi:hypothetical protein
MVWPALHGISASRFFEINLAHLERGMMACAADDLRPDPIVAAPLPARSELEQEGLPQAVKRIPRGQ